MRFSEQPTGQIRLIAGGLPRAFQTPAPEVQRGLRPAQTIGGKKQLLHKVPLVAVVGNAFPESRLVGVRIRLQPGTHPRSGFPRFFRLLKFEELRVATGGSGQPIAKTSRRQFGAVNVKRSRQEPLR